MAKTYHIVLAIDWGTWKTVMAFTISDSRGEYQMPVTPLRDAYNNTEIRMLATYIDGKIVHGSELESQARENPELSDKIIDLFKLDLYESEETAAVRERNNSILQDFPGQPKIDTLISDHLKALVKDAREAIARSDAVINFTVPELRAMECRIRITVPQMWPPDSRRRMTAAAHKAGLPLVVLASEPQCALAYYIDKASSRKFDTTHQLQRGNSILVADLGSGTGDFVTYKLETRLSTHSRLKAIDSSSGGPCGSHEIDTILLEILLKKMGKRWYTSSRIKLGVTDRDFTRRALLAVEDVKKKFGINDGVGPGHIWGPGGVVVPFTISRTDMLQALDTVIKKIVDRIDHHIHRNKPKFIYVTGGFAKSGILLKRLEDRYMVEKALGPGISVIRPSDDMDCCYPVAIGALRRYDSINTQDLPSQFGYAMLRREEFDPETHIDSKLEDAWVQASPYNEDIKVVDGRIFNLLKKGERLCDVETQTLEFRVPCHDPSIEAEFVYLTRDFEDSIMALKYTVEADKITKEELREGVHRWVTVSIPLDEDELKRKAFETVVADDNSLHWLLNVRVRLVVNQSEIQVVFEILKPSAEVKREDEDDGDVEMDPIVYRLWDAAHSEFLE